MSIVEAFLILVIDYEDSFVFSIVGDLEPIPKIDRNIA
jgi:anthranilate/para-aminobenzoate synthase component II